jgi:hypothetical protein
MIKFHFARANAFILNARIQFETTRIDGSQHGSDFGEKVANIQPQRITKIGQRLLENFKSGRLGEDMG